MSKVLFLLVTFSVFSFGETFFVNDSNEFREALKKASSNGQSDKIVLNKGVYKTSKNNLGTFSFLDNEEFDLTIESANNLDKKEVVLDGSGRDQVLNYTNTKNSTLYLRNITIANGKVPSIAGVIFTNQSIDIENCNILNSYSVQNNSIFAFKNLKMSNTNIYDN